MLRRTTALLRLVILVAVVAALAACASTSAPAAEPTVAAAEPTTAAEPTATAEPTTAAEPAASAEMTATAELTDTAESTTTAQLANPASQNCVDQGGTLSIQESGDGGQYGVCMFEDNMQCEEWAMMRGECPVGGIKVTGFVTPAATYCAITGGEYAVTANSNTADEQGTCTFKNGTVCDASEYYNGQCSAE